MRTILIFMAEYFVYAGHSENEKKIAARYDAKTASLEIRLLLLQHY
jgi:hypothetical protein